MGVGWFRRCPPEGLAPSEPEAVEDQFDDHRAGASARAIVGLLDEIEATALAIYAAFDLPIVPGHYARSPRSKRWKFITDDLTPEERWALALANPGWRFSTMESLGDHDAPELQRAAQLLADCRRLRDCSTDREELEAAIRLGAEWRALQHATPKPEVGRLKFEPVSDARPVAKKRRSGSGKGVAPRTGK
jgi:hypothetical protein